MQISGRKLRQAGTQVISYLVILYALRSCTLQLEEHRDPNNIVYHSGSTCYIIDAIRVCSVLRGNIRGRLIYGQRSPTLRPYYRRSGPINLATTTSQTL